ncbi:hypothetical protein AVEN_19587-1 [Araneus ventricosus]|uniref:Uncharacterized protein n=1 Tax=Araneus ventricosus TaxID=182803 RepID=A0A4Y2P240_ARAVE|nr:hypothetical protein AVEN_19587-1 [Araneus ventricosus]
MLIDWDRLGARTSLEFYLLCELIVKSECQVESSGKRMPPFAFAFNRGIRIVEATRKNCAMCGEGAMLQCPTMQLPDFSFRSQKKASACLNRRV